MHANAFNSIKYSATYKKSVSVWDVIVAISYLVVAVLELKNGLSDHLNNKLWYVMRIGFDLLLGTVFSFSLLSLVFSRTHFEIADQKLIVTSAYLFKKKSIYDVNKMEDIEVERVKHKKFLPTEIITTKQNVVTFFYNEKEIALGWDLSLFNAQSLKVALQAAKSSS